MASPNTTFSVGAVLTAAQQNNFPFGRVAAPISITTNQGSITGQVDITGATITFTAIAGRLYKACWGGLFNSTVSTDTFNFLLTDGSNNIQQQAITCPATTADVSFIGFHVFTPGAGSITRKLRVQRQSGSGTGTIVAGATFPTIFWIEDIGLA
jgi:hypothetical protein